MLKPRRRRLAAGFWPADDSSAAARRIWPPLGMALAAAVLAALIMPRQSPFPYRFEAGHPWNYAVLKAPFDYEVLYPEEEIREQMKQINAEHAPYYRLDPEVARLQKRLLADFINERSRVSQHDARYEDLVKNPSRYRSYGQQLLDKLYEQGIAGPELAALAKVDPGARIYLVQAGKESRIRASDVPSLDAARQFLIDTLPYSPLRQPELLLPILEKNLAPNVFYSDSLTQLMRRKKIAAVASTGITVRRGETIVKKGELISEEIYRKLDSLNRRYEVPKGFIVVAGYALLAFIGFALFFFWLKSRHAAIWNNREALLTPPVIILLLLTVTSFLCWIGPAVALLAPLWGLPLLLRRALGLDVSLAAWGLLLLLSTTSMDWSAGWLAIQLVGAAGLLIFMWEDGNWIYHGRAILITLLLQTLAWWGSLLAGKMPAGVQSVDALLFLAAANALLFGLLPMRKLLADTLGTDELGAGQ